MFLILPFFFICIFTKTNLFHFIDNNDMSKMVKHTLSLYKLGGSLPLKISMIQFWIEEDEYYMWNEGYKEV